MGNIFQKTALVSCLTLISRILGVVRDALIAMFFGTSSQTDAFFIAFRPFDLSRKLFSEGILSIAFIPVFSKAVEKNGHPKAVLLVFSFFCFLSIFSVVLILSGMLFAPLVIKVIAPGFIVNTETATLTIYLFTVMLPYLWCIIIVALFMGVLNTYGKFGAPALAPVLFNLAVIIFTIYLCNFFDMPIKGLAFGVTIGGMVQLGVQIPFLYRLGLFKVQWKHIFQPEIYTVVKTMVPCMVGAASYQINIMVASFFASTLPSGSVSYIYYADRLVQFPLALFAVSVATVFLPELSNKANSKNHDDIGQLFSNGVKLVFFIVIPAMAGLMVLNQEIVAFLFGQGRFDDTAIVRTGTCLYYLVTGLWAFAGVRIFVTLFYAIDSIKIPFYCGLVSIGINFAGCFFLVHTLGLTGLVLSVSLSSIIGFILLFFNIPSKANINRKSLLFSTCRSLFLSVIMLFIVKGASLYLFKNTAGKFEMGADLFFSILLGIAVYIGLNVLVANPDFLLVKKTMIEKFNVKR